MLVVEMVARIRREFFVKGKSLKEIARALGVSRNTVRKVVRSGQTGFSYERAVQPLPKLGAWTANLDRLLEVNEGKARRERLTLVRIYEELQGLGQARVACRARIASVTSMTPPLGPHPVNATGAAARSPRVIARRCCPDRRTRRGEKRWRPERRLHSPTGRSRGRRVSYVWR